MKSNIKLKHELNEAIDSGDFEKADAIVKKLNTKNKVRKPERFSLKRVCAVAAAAVLFVTIAAVSITAAVRGSLAQSGVYTNSQSDSCTVKDYINVADVSGTLGDFKLTVNDYLKNEITNTGIISVTIENTAKDNRFFYAVVDAASKEDDEVLNTGLKGGLNGRPVVFQSRECRSDVFTGFDSFVSDRMYFVEAGSDSNTLNAVIFFSAGDKPLDKIYLNSADMSEKLTLEINAQKSLPVLKINGADIPSEITLSAIDICVPGESTCTYLSLIMRDASEKIIKSPDENADIYALFGSTEEDGRSFYVFSRFIDTENVSAIKYNDCIIKVPDR